MTAIAVNDVSFAFKQNLILSHICCRIPEHKIYGLLGPSGAGKTSLLRLILGRIKPKDGFIQVFGSAPGVNNHVTGYMPQDTALALDFSVEETLQYFASIYRLSKREFETKKAILSSVLQLPRDDHVIRELSGGQQKRVSLALAFLNSPRLVILDEPTVGTDPLLGHAIWTYLHENCSQGVTIVVVTHYIEEAALGHVVGIMRAGKLMEEGVPQDLLVKYGEKSLESVFLTLCKTDSIVKQNSISETKHEKRREAEREERKGEKERESLVLSLWILLVLIKKNFSKFLGINVSFLIFLIPAFQALILCLLYNRSDIPIKVSVFNEEKNPFLSERLLKSIKKVDVYYLDPVTVNTREEGLINVEKGETNAFLHFHENYSQTLLERITSSEELSNSSLSSSSLHLYLDNTNFLYANGIQDSLRITLFSLIGDLFLERNLSRIDSPLKVVETIYAQNSKLSDFLLPGYLISFIYLSQVSLSSQLLIQERKDGLFERSLICGVKHNLVFFSHFFTSFLLSFIQILLMIFISLFVFQITNYGKIEIILLLVLIQSLNAISIGLLISSLVEEGFVAVLVSIFITFSQLFTSGAIFPFELVSPSLRKVLYYSPIAMPTESLRNVMLRGWNLSYFYVLHGLALNLGSGLIFLMLAMIIFQRKS